MKSHSLFVSSRDNLHEKSQPIFWKVTAYLSPEETICMKSQSLFVSSRDNLHEKSQPIFRKATAYLSLQKKICVKSYSLFSGEKANFCKKSNCRLLELLHMKPPMNEERRTATD